MKLYLSSQHMGSASHVLLEMIGDKKRVGVKPMQLICLMVVIELIDYKKKRLD